jgi:DegV family protein with EDD domain
MTEDEYYDMILDAVKTDEFPTTSQITPTAFLEIFEGYYEAGVTDLIYTSIASGGSATYGNAKLARDEFFEAHPEAEKTYRIHIIDGGNYSGTYGFPVIQAALKAQKGASAADLVAYITDWCKYAEVDFGCYTLQFIKRSGRVSAAAAFVGELLGLRPILRIKQAESAAIGKVRGDKAVIPKVVDIVAERIIPGTPYVLVVGKDKSLEQDLFHACTKRLGYPPEMTFYIGSAVAANSGPYVAGVIFKSRII